MQISPNFELVNIAGDYLAVPVGEMAARTKDVFAFSQSAGFLLSLLKNPMTKDEMIDAITNEYGLNIESVEKDVDLFLSQVISYGIVSE